MIKQEYKRYLRSKGNIMILFLSVVPIVVSYYTTWLEKMDWIRQYQNPGSDVSDAEGFLTLANGYNCFTYLSEFLFSSDFMVFFMDYAHWFCSCFGNSIVQSLPKWIWKFAGFPYGI